MSVRVEENEVGQKTDPTISTAAHIKSAGKSDYNIDAFHEQGATHSNNLAADGGHYLDQDVKSFDAPFFNITTRKPRPWIPRRGCCWNAPTKRWKMRD